MYTNIFLTFGFREIYAFIKKHATQKFSERCKVESSILQALNKKRLCKLVAHVLLCIDCFVSFEKVLERICFNDFVAYEYNDFLYHKSNDKCLELDFGKMINECRCDDVEKFLRGQAILYDEIDSHLERDDD